MRNFFGKLILPAVAIATSAVLGTSVKAGTVYAFAEQKAYNMTLTSVNNAGNLTNGAFNISTNTSAGLAGYPGQSFTVPILDAQQSYLGSAPAPVENLSSNAVNPPSQQVLSQYNVTPAGTANQPVNNLPGAGSFTIPTFSRSDAVTWNPPANSSVPLPAGYLFNPAFTGGNVSIDSAAEALLNNQLVGNGLAQSGWQINGSFSLSSTDSVRLSFDMINRLVAFADTNNQVASAQSSFTFLITSQTFPFTAVYNPSPVASSLSFPVIGSTTVNSNGSNALISPVLAAGNYNFSISATTRSEVSLVPEPASYVMMGLGLVTMGGLRYRRKLLNVQGK
ncbi:MAG: EDSAP-1 family PEP-CTERM protein [bacterium]